MAVTDLSDCLRADNLATIAACGGAVNARSRSFESPNYGGAGAPVPVQFRVYISLRVAVSREVASE